MTAKASLGVITGFGPFGYHMGLLSLTQILNEMKAAQEAQQAAQVQQQA
jgi:3-dehydroquinate dehydratase-2